jgi:hypothetical protein
MYNNEIEMENQRNLDSIKKTNPLALPPAGKNFYNYDNKEIFLAAQKQGSMSVPAYVDQRSSPQSQNIKIVEDDKRTGKRLFFNNYYPNDVGFISRFEIDSPLKFNYKLDNFLIDAPKNM